MVQQTAQILRVDFELDASDIAYFRGLLETARKGWQKRDDDHVLIGAERTITKALETNPPRYVRQCIGKLQRMTDMVKDYDWKLEGADREYVFQALAYFADDKDLIRDDVPGIGFLDDAIMIDLVAIDLQHDLEAYEEFCANRDNLSAGDADAQPLDKAREVFQSRMRRRRRRGLRTAPGGEAVTSLFHPG